jgi:hypothetical protein
VPTYKWALSHLCGRFYELLISSDERFLHLYDRKDLQTFLFPNNDFRFLLCSAANLSRVMLLMILYEVWLLKMWLYLTFLTIILSMQDTC